MHESEQLALIGSLRELWLQIAVWMRSLIVSAAGSLGDVRLVMNRLFRIPEDFSEVLSGYFEPQETDRIRELLEENISAVSALIMAEKNGDEKTVNRETMNLYANAGRMADYLAGINPYWNREQWTEALNDYIEILLADLVARMSGNFTEEIIIFDDLQTQAAKIADIMSLGMIQKFRP